MGQLLDPHLVRCDSPTCSANAFNVSDAQLRQWEWTQDEMGRIYWLCRRCLIELNTEGA